jgi:hypothetical protein
MLPLRRRYPLKRSRGSQIDLIDPIDHVAPVDVLRDIVVVQKRPTWDHQNM